MYIDTHAHLYASQFEEDKSEVINRAISSGVNKILLPNIDLASVEGMYALENKYPSIFHAMMGLHPCSVDENFENVIQQIELELQKRDFIAIGEIGIDLYWDKSFLEQQKKAFAIQIEWAKKRKIPIVIHARDSFQEIFDVLDQHNSPDLTGVFHCFTGGLAEIEKTRSYGGFYFGIGGVVTFKKAELAEVLLNFSLEELILETDAPYLAPHPYRGKRNESSYIPIIANKLAEIYQVPVEKIAQQTTINAQKLFHLA